MAAMLGMNVPNSQFPGEEKRQEYSCEPTVKVAADQFGPMCFAATTEQAGVSGVSMVSPDPAAYVGESMALILAQHGTADHLVRWAQSEVFVAALKESIGVF